MLAEESDSVPSAETSDEAPRRKANYNSSLNVSRSCTIGVYRNFARCARGVLVHLLIGVLCWTLCNSRGATAASEPDDDRSVKPNGGAPHHILPSNSHIPEHVLEELVAQNLPRIVAQLGIPVTEASLRDRKDKPTADRCNVAEDFEQHSRRHGCYIGVYVCDKQFSGHCFWSFRRQCECPRLWILKTYECRIMSLTVPLPNSEYEFMKVPVGECRLAVWIWVITIAASLPVLWILVFRGVRFAFQKLY